MSTIKVLVNATNIKVGGGLQVATSVVASLIRDPRGLDLKYVVSYQVYRQLELLEVCLDELIILNMNINKPFSFLKTKRELRKIEVNESCDVVFTLFGPGFHSTKKAIHLVGFANAWLVQPNTRAYSLFPFPERVLKKLKNKLLAWSLYSKANYYVTETYSVADDFCHYFKAEKDKISVVGNCLSHAFTKSYSDNQFEALMGNDNFKFLTISHNYPHKNLATIGAVGEQLERMLGRRRFTFIVTLSDVEYEKMGIDFKKYTTNVGNVSIIDCPKLYDCCDALYLPTLIECFSVSYLEAMYKNMPIATSKLDFAQEICPSGTYYFDPYCYLSISKSLKELIFDKFDDELKVSENENRKLLANFGNNENRVDKYVDLINSIKYKVK